MNRIVTLNDIKAMIPISQELDDYIKAYLESNLEEYLKMFFEKHDSNTIYSLKEILPELFI